MYSVLQIYQTDFFVSYEVIWDYFDLTEVSLKVIILAE